MGDRRPRPQLTLSAQAAVPYSADVADDDRVVLTVVAGESEAELVCGLLRASGFACAYRDTEALDSPFEGFIASGQREVLVHAGDLEAARALLEDAQR